MKYILTLVKITLLIYAISYVYYADYTSLVSLISLNQLYALLLLLIFHALRTQRFSNISNAVKSKISYLNLLVIYYHSLSLAIITPGGIGELYRIKLFKDKGLDNWKIYNFLMLEKVTDIIAILTILLLVISKFFFGLNIFFLFFIIVIIISLLIYILHISLSFLFNNGPVLKSQSIKRKVINLIQSILEIEKIDFIKIYLFTTVYWLIFLLVLYVGLSSLHTFNIEEMMSIFVINSVSVALPISYMGYGVREIILESTIFSSEKSLYIAAIALQYTLIYFTSVLIGVMVILINKFYLWKKK